MSDASEAESNGPLIERPKRSMWPLFGIALALAGGVTVYVATSRDDATTSRTPDAAALERVLATTPPAPAEEWEEACPGPARQVIYGADGSAPYGDYTIQTPSGISQGGFDTPMTNTSGSRGLRMCFAPGSFVYVSVQNGTESGTISCSITVDGVTIAENRSSGAYVIATCEGST